jgi:alpha-beta hydrolase superfamily lysophospholipase
VFVHGLGGHPFETWSTRDVYWPKDLLGPRVQNIRIITFGYDANAAKVSERVSTKNLHDHARALVSDLERQRQKPEEVARPIIFMAHSLGGIVVKDVCQLRDTYNFGLDLLTI